MRLHHTNPYFGNASFSSCLNPFGFLENESASRVGQISASVNLAGGTAEAVVMAKRTCKFDQMAIFHIILMREDLNFVFPRLCPKGKLCLAWW